MNDARMQQLLADLGRRWPDGGPAGNPAIVEAIRPHVDRLGLADRALARAVRSFKSADSQVTILSQSVARLEERRDNLVQLALNARAQAGLQKSSSGQTTLLRVAGERDKELLEFDRRFGDQWGQLAAAKRDMRGKRSQLGPLRKRVSDLEGTIGRAFPLVARAEDHEGTLLSHSPTGNLCPEHSGGHEAAHSHDDADGALSQAREPFGPAEPKRTGRWSGIGTRIRRRVRRIRRSPRSRRAGKATTRRVRRR